MDTHKPTHEDLPSTIYGQMGFAIFIIIFGLAYLLPEQYVPEGTLLLSAGLIMLAVSGMKWAKKIAVDWLDVAVGAIFLVNGINNILGLGLAVLPVLLVIFGFCMLVSLLIRNHALNAQNHSAPNNGI